MVPETICRKYDTSICLSSDKQLHRRTFHIAIYFQTFIEMTRLVGFVGDGKFQSLARTCRSFRIIHLGTTARSHHIVYHERLVARILEQDFTRLGLFFRKSAEIQFLSGEFHRCLDGGRFLFLSRKQFQIEFLDVGILDGIANSYDFVLLVEKKCS